MNMAGCMYARLIGPGGGMSTAMTPQISSGSSDCIATATFCAIRAPMPGKVFGSGPKCATFGIFHTPYQEEGWSESHMKPAVQCACLLLIGRERGVSKNHTEGAAHDPGPPLLLRRAGGADNGCYIGGDSLDRFGNGHQNLKVEARKAEPVWLFVRLRLKAESGALR